MAQNRSHEVLRHAWIEWRKASGNMYKQDYIDFIKMNNDGAHSMGNNYIRLLISTNLLFNYYLMLVGMSLFNSPMNDFCC